MLGAAVIVLRVEALQQRFNPLHYNSSAQRCGHVSARQDHKRGVSQAAVSTLTAEVGT